MRLALLALAPLFLSACLADPRPRLVDCDSLAEEQAECMDDEAMADCLQANEDCAESGTVEVGESCPLTFTCYQEGSI
ncbi:MAG: hypothetical protein IT382_24220 [Deltaproteobacteria bacterium]|nr:hypothetical protein [Deltaproteobacteria bacterium]